MAEIVNLVASQPDKYPTEHPISYYAPRYQWRILPDNPAPSWLVDMAGAWAAQLLWQRGKQTPEAVQEFINPDQYQPTSGWAFGAEMTAAVARLQTAYQEQETVIIWGDFDSDGITATAVLWEGLAPWFPPNERLYFYIPDRLQESHGLSLTGLDLLRQHLPTAKLIITCDTGSSNHDEIIYAQNLGFELIITDHHTLPPQRPPVIALINSRNFAPDHPLYHLSGVAVAYKLIEVLYEVMPDAPTQGCENLLDLVTIGLIADLVQLEGDCRYLAQKGLHYLSTKLNARTRPGLTALVTKCRTAGDRARDISYGIAPRLNAGSRIWGKVDQCVELLTTKNQKQAEILVERLELANAERKDLQRQTKLAINQRIQLLDLSTTGVILLADPNWSVGILGLVAGELVKEHQRPVILCTIDGDLAKGSARAPAGIDLYKLLQGQEHLLTKFGGHPLAGGLSFPLVHLPLLEEALNQNFWQYYRTQATKELTIDLTVKLPEINKKNIENLTKLEPYGMGNPIANVRICNVIFQAVKFKPLYVKRNKGDEKLKSGYVEFTLCDPISNYTIKGRSYEHHKSDLPEGLCDVVVNLNDANTYHVILLDVIVTNSGVLPTAPTREILELPPLNLTGMPPVWDYRTLEPDLYADHTQAPDHVWCQQCPASWQKLHYWLDEGAKSKGLILSYVLPHSVTLDDKHTWRRLVGIAKYLQRVGDTVPWQQVGAKLEIDQPRLLYQGLQALADYGYQIMAVDPEGEPYHYTPQELDPPTLNLELDDSTDQLVEENWLISGSVVDCASNWQMIKQNPPYQYPNISPNLEIFWAGVTEYRFQQQFFDSQWQNYQSSGLKLAKPQEYRSLYESPP